MTAPTPSVFRLRGAIQNYPWGKDGSDSLAAQLASGAIGKDFEIDEKTAYAELWMGTHPNGQAYLWDQPDTVTLAEHLAQHPQLLGKAQRFPPKNGLPASLPFLFKILTCKKALPLQIHPDKQLAEQLHKEDPEQFNDTNHKPEIAVALAPFQGFVGFRPVQKIVATIKHMTDLNDVLPKRQREAFLSEPTPSTLRALFAALLKISTDEAKPVINRIAEKINKEGASALGEGIPNADKVAMVLQKLNSQYEGDPGVLGASIFMNLQLLEIGQAIYAGADEAHAWLEGAIVELMAASDNVLNVGTTDDSEKNNIDLFERAVTCQPRPAESYLLARRDFPKSTNNKTRFYQTPFEEFNILHKQIDGADTIKGLSGPAVYIVTQGRGRLNDEAIERGAIIFVGADTPVTLPDGIEAWAAFYDE